MSRAKRIEVRIIDKMWNNGGHWLQLELKSGDKIYIQRQNFQPYENLDREKFRVAVNGVDTLDKATIEEVAAFINSKY